MQKKYMKKKRIDKNDKYENRMKKEKKNIEIYKQKCSE